MGFKFWQFILKQLSPLQLCCTRAQSVNKKLSYRRETARQLSARHTFLGSLTDRAHHRIPHLLYNYTVSGKKRPPLNMSK